MLVFSFLRQSLDSQGDLDLEVCLSQLPKGEVNKCEPAGLPFLVTDGETDPERGMSARLLRLGNRRLVMLLGPEPP